MATKMSDAEVKKRLARLDGWAIKSGCLVKEFKFKDFSSAMEFMNALVPVAEKLDHHPDWTNSYGKVFISLQTHSVSGLTEKDFAFAEAAQKAQ